MDEKKTGDFKGVHYVWETGVWIQVSGRRLVQHADGTCRIIPADQVVTSDRLLPNDLRPCTVKARDDGMFYWQPAEHAATKKWIYYRGDAVENEKALQDALPALYKSFHPDAQMEK
jgi:pyrimidine-specific ribonucleoside hydrolase